MKVNINNPISLSKSAEENRQLASFKEKAVSIDNTISAFEFQLLNQKDLYAQLDLIKNAGSYNSPDFNHHKLDASTQTPQSFDANKTAKLEEYAQRRLPSLVDSIFDEIAKRSGLQHLGDEFSAEKTHISHQVYAAISSDEPSALYDAINSNLFSLSQISFAEQGFNQVLDRFDRDKPFNTREGISGHIGSLQAKYDKAHADTIANNKDETFVKIIKSRREDFSEPLKHSLTKTLGFNPYENPSYAQHYMIGIEMPIDLNNGFQRNRPLSLMV